MAVRIAEWELRVQLEALREQTEQNTNTSDQQYRSPVRKVDALVGYYPVEAPYNHNQGASDEANERIKGFHRIDRSLGMQRNQILRNETFEERSYLEQKGARDIEENRNGEFASPYPYANDPSVQYSNPYERDVLRNRPRVVNSPPHFGNFRNQANSRSNNSPIKMSAAAIISQPSMAQNVSYYKFPRRLGDKLDRFKINGKNDEIKSEQRDRSSNGKSEPLSRIKANNSPQLAISEKSKSISISNSNSKSHESTQSYTYHKGNKKDSSDPCGLFPKVEIYKPAPAINVVLVGPNDTSSSVGGSDGNFDEYTDLFDKMYCQFSMKIT